jgi:hypothetical protein
MYIARETSKVSLALDPIRSLFLVPLDVCFFLLIGAVGDL